jgi:ATP/maltotriose-dependent transcriptional regulator MalT
MPVNPSLPPPSLAPSWASSGIATPTRSAPELEELRLVAAGSTNRTVAHQLFVSEATVKTHLLHLYAKLGERATAYKRGLLG